MSIRSIGSVWRCALVNRKYFVRVRHSSSLDATAFTRRLADHLSETQPRFTIYGESVRILQQPKQFYGTLMEMIGRAKRRIVLSSLYVGTEEHELLRALNGALQRSPELTLDLHLDCLRSTRPESPSTAEFLTPLIRTFGEDRVRIHLFRTPKLRGMMAKLVPRRFDEGWGTWHAKLYAVDDEVMFSGANMNSSYFRDRQDRYLHFPLQPELAEYAVEYAKILSAFTYRLIPAAGPSPSSEPFDLVWKRQDSRPQSFEALACQAVHEFQSRWRAKLASSEAAGDTTIFPLIQSGILGVREEEKAIAVLLKNFAESGQEASIDLTSGYFGLFAPYKRAVLESPSSLNWRIVAASPKANGFYGSKGLSGRLPEAYTWLERRFWHAAREVGKVGSPAPSVELNEWQREGWTYHAKGIWARFCERAKVDGAPPTISLFGSTNLNRRSANLDTELSFLMLTSDSSLSRSLQSEVDNIRAHAMTVGEDVWSRPERQVRWSTKAMARIVGGML